MVQSVEERPAANDKDAKTITVTVNNRSVIFDVRRATGAQIKAAAIQQGVPIQPDFVLFEVRGQGKLDPISDDEQVVLHARQQFRAVAPDDTSGVHR